jgi:hypothetical protein
MSSLKQIDANRRNAFKSTGPTTSEGKERSRRNALRHGLTAETVIARLEDQEDYQAFEAAIIADYDAQSAVERELVLRLASVFWRLRRATGIEAALFEQQNPESSELELAPSEHDRQTDWAKPKQVCPKIVDPAHAASPNEIYENMKWGIANAFLRLAALPTLPLDRLSRYEQTLWRQARQIVEALRGRRRQQRKSGFPFSFR